MHELLHALTHALSDCARLLPFLFATIFLMEYIEHRAADRFVSSVRRAGRFGPLLGAGLGCLPQCGFSAACAELFNGGLVSAGTLLAVFLSTSDEAVPILLANPGGWQDVLRLLGAKVVIAIVAGFALDAVWSREKQQRAFREHSAPHVCKSDEKLIHILLAALRRTLGIFLFLFCITFTLSILIELLGEDRLAALLLPGPFQPVIAAFVGLIPNCAASVLLTQLYLDGMLSFGAAVAGLCSSAGIGLLILLRGKHGVRTYAILIGSGLLASILSGSLLQLLP